MYDSSLVAQAERVSRIILDDAVHDANKILEAMGDRPPLYKKAEDLDLLDGYLQGRDSEQWWYEQTSFFAQTRGPEWTRNWMLGLATWAKDLIDAHGGIGPARAAILERRKQRIRPLVRKAEAELERPPILVEAPLPPWDEALAFGSYGQFEDLGEPGEG